MQQCESAEEILLHHGEPGHKQQQGDLEIWHYPLGIHAGTFYSIHVAVSSDQTPMAYLHLAPTTSTKRPWWKIW